MGRTNNPNQQINHPVGRPGARDPSVVMARDQFTDADDAHRLTVHYPNDTLCTTCDAVYRDQRWMLDEPRKAMLLAAGAPHQVVCPACRIAHGGLPQGIVTLQGTYWPLHREEIVNLIRHQEGEALQDNPMERISALREEEGRLIVETTSEKLAQKIGRSVRKAHQGEIEYQWSDGNHLVRVNWERNA